MKGSSGVILLIFLLIGSFKAGAISQYYPAVQSSPPSFQQAEKRDSIGK